MLEVYVMKPDELHELQNIYSDPYIKTISHDHRQAGIIVHPNATYLTAKINKKIVGAFLVIKYSATELELHSLLKKEALRQSRELGTMCINWAFSNKEVLRVTAYVIDGLNKAKNYCLKLGFMYEGKRRNALLKNGIKTDVHILGITRDEWRTK